MSERSLTDLEVRTFGREGDVWKKLVFLCVFLALNSCTAGVGENEDVAETTEAEAAGQVRDGLKIADLDLRTDEEVQRDVEQSLSGWKVYLARGKPDARSDRLVVYKDENDRKSWIWLSPREHQRRGDAYFEKLKREHRLSAMDMVGIMSAIQQAGDRPTLLPARHMTGPGCIGPECGGVGSPGSSTPWTLGGDHTGPAAGHQPPSPGGGGAHPPPTSGPPHRGGPTPDELKKWRDDVQKKRDEQQRRREEFENRVPKDAPPALPSPTDGTYKPRWGEYKERYMCEGTVYYGYRGGCIDFQDKSIDVKMTTKLGNWINSDNFIGKMTHADWTTFCKFAVTFVAVAGCVAVAGGCGTAEVITIGGATLPCVMVVALLCNAHAGTGALLADRCHIAMDLR